MCLLPLDDISTLGDVLSTQYLQSNYCLFVNYGLLLFCQVVVALYYVGKLIICFCRAMKYPLLHSCLLDQVSVVGFHAVLVFSGFVLEFTTVYKYLCTLPIVLEFNARVRERCFRIVALRVFHESVPPSLPESE
jgi:hypothetical protein